MLKIPKIVNFKYTLKEKLPWHYCNLCRHLGYNLICKKCLNNLAYTQDNACNKCRKNPLPINQNICSECIQQDIKWNKYYCDFIYTEPLKNMLHQLKYHKQKKFSYFLGFLLFHSIYEALEIKLDSNNHLVAHKTVDMIIPVPLHKNKQKSRSFNQVEELLYYYLHKKPQIINAPIIDKNILSRITNNEAQALSNKTQRIKNLANAFKLNAPVIDKTILLIDDVLTSGATLKNVTQLLKDNGAKSVEICTLLRTI